MYFNGNPVSEVARYVEAPDATTGGNYTYATICYNVHFNHDDALNVEAVLNKTADKMVYAISGMGLVVVYNDNDAPLMRYYIGEGGDVIMAKNKEFHTSFKYEDCTRKVNFNGVIDPHLANATLLTVLTEWAAEKPCDEAGGEGDRLLFNQKKVGELLAGTTSHWEYQPPPPGKNRVDIALTKNKWEYVDDVKGNNLAQIQSRGTYFFLTNAFLNVTYPPDLVRPALPSKVFVGNTIPVVIYNQGRTDARDFYVSFYVDGEFKGKEHIDEIVGGESRELTFPWTAPITKVGHLVELKVWVDSEDDVTELREDNNNASRVTEVSLGGLEHNLDGGEDRKGPRFGREYSDIESVEAGAPIASKAAIGKSEGEKITGYLMKGRVAQSEGGGGGGSERTEFSWVGLLIRIAMLAVAAVLVYAGYLLERRRQNNINNEK